MIFINININHLNNFQVLGICQTQSDMGNRVSFTKILTDLRATSVYPGQHFLEVTGLFLRRYLPCTKVWITIVCHLLIVFPIKKSSMKMGLGSVYNSNSTSQVLFLEKIVVLWYAAEVFYAYFCFTAWNIKIYMKGWDF